MGLCHVVKRPEVHACSPGLLISYEGEGSRNPEKQVTLILEAKLL